MTMNEPKTLVTTSARCAQLKAYFEGLSRESAMNIGEFYADGVWFKDPFNEVNTLDEVRHIFAKMFDQVESPRFVVGDMIEQGDQLFMTWDFLFSIKGINKGKSMVCRGSSHLRFDANNKVVYHRDYWDTSEELYEKIPLVGGFMRWLKSRAA